jgi:hypothetical protein
MNMFTIIGKTNEGHVVATDTTDAGWKAAQIAPAWKVRRVTDSVGASTAKAGLYRLITRDGVELIRAELQRQGWEIAPAGGAK